MQREHLDEALEELDRRVQMHAPERYPVQHATAQFHRGVLLLERGDHQAAQAAFEAAIALFDPRGLPVEHAKATNMLGVALRSRGEPASAVDRFTAAARAFEKAGLGLEHGAALFNLGLARREAGDLHGSADALRRARRLLDEERVGNQAGAAARELGVTLLHRGDVGEAVAVLREAIEMAGRARDEPGVGAGCNALGLALLALRQHGEAIAAFKDAAAADPRPLRPGAHATAKANLALAYEAAGDVPRARLAAGQACAMGEAPRAAVDQAREVLKRLGRGESDLIAVLRQEREDVWHRIIYEELLRWLEVDHRVRDVGVWIRDQAREHELGDRLAQAWLAALLELPTDAMQRLIAAALEASATVERSEADTWRGQVRRAMRTFPGPQFDRLRKTFVNLDEELGGNGSWT